LGAGAAVVDRRGDAGRVVWRGGGPPGIVRGGRGAARRRRDRRGGRNLLNNLPAVLVLSHALTAQHAPPGLLLAALIGVNVGPNLTCTGSLATLLWRRVLRHHDAEPALGDFLRLLDHAPCPVLLLWLGPPPPRHR
jgi:Arsenical pump membrane protein